jgi:PAS domain S-box-containing protein
LEKDKAVFEDFLWKVFTNKSKIVTELTITGDIVVELCGHNINFISPFEDVCLITAVDITGLHSIIQNTKKTNAYLEKLINYANVPIIVWDPQFRITRFNHAFEKITGQTEQEAMGKSLEILFPPKSVANSMALIKKTQSSERWEVVEIDILHKDKTIRTILWNSATIFDDGKMPIATIAQGHDISERKKALLIIQQSEERFKNLSYQLEGIIDHIPGLVYYKDKKNNFIRVNKYLANLLKKEKAAIEGVHLSKLYPTATAEKYLQDDLLVINSGIAKLNYEEATGDNGEIWLRTSKIPYRDDKGNIIGIIGISTDITQLKEDQKKLAEYKILLETSEEMAHIGGWQFDTQTLTQNWTDEIFRILEIDMENGTPKVPEVLDFINEPYRVLAAEGIQHTIETGEPYYQQWEITTAKGNIRWVHFIGKLNKMEDAKKVLFGSFQDITEIKMAEAKINELNKDLDKKVQERTRQYELVNKDLEAFTFSVSHDLRAPLRAVNSYAQILQEDYTEKLDADGKNMLQYIQQNGLKMGRLIDDLLAFSLLGRKEIKKKEINMNELTKAAVDELNKSFANHAKIAVSELPPIQADYDLMYQVMINLISNAIKYSGKKENPLIEIYTQQKDNNTVFTIKDNGAGFDMQYASKLFGVFQRLHSEQEFEGNGIGLSLVQRIITRHGGKAWGEGKVNEGATFYFTLN